jgi:hypothetical protein
MTNIFDEVIRPKAMELLKRAVLPDDQVKAGNQKSIFINDLAKMKYQHDANGQIIILDANGFEIQDNHGYTLTVDQVLQSEFNKYFEITDLPISENECISRLKNEKITPDERKRITDHWNKLKKR